MVAKPPRGNTPLAGCDFDVEPTLRALDTSLRAPMELHAANFKIPVSPYPLNLGVTISPPKFWGRPPENTVKQGASDTPPPKFRCEMAPPIFRGYGHTGSPLMQRSVGVVAGA